MNVLERDTVMGTFTHTTEYLPSIEGSIEKFYPDITYIRQLAPLPINANFEALREKFKQSGKRYWLFLDHDIQFLSPDTIRIALESLVRNKYACMGVYSSYMKDYVPKPEELTEREVGWVPGYFQLIDSHKVGHIGADMNLPDPTTAIDTSYCVAIRSMGHKIGIAPAWVYHQYKPLNLCYHHVIAKTNEYLMQKWGRFYFDTCQYCGCLVGPDPGAEIWNLSEEQLEAEMVAAFEENCNIETNGAIGRNMMNFFKEIGQTYDHITEFGVQKGSSTIGFASGKPKHLRGYEIFDTMHARTKALLGRYVGWKYRNVSSLEVNIDPTDVLFIDSDHMYDQLIQELHLHSHKVKSLILLHDTLNCGPWGERGTERGLLAAINDFLEKDNHWRIEKTFFDGHGLTVLRRVQ